MKTQEEISASIKDVEKVEEDLRNRALILKWALGRTVEEIEYEIKSLSGLNTRMLALQWILEVKERTQED